MIEWSLVEELCDAQEALEDSDGWELMCEGGDWYTDAAARISKALIAVVRAAWESHPDRASSAPDVIAAHALRYSKIRRFAGTVDGWQYATDGHALMRWKGQPCSGPAVRDLPKSAPSMFDAPHRVSMPVSLVELEGPHGSFAGLAVGPARFAADLVSRWTPVGWVPTEAKAGADNEPAQFSGPGWDLLVMPVQPGLTERPR